METIEQVHGRLYRVPEVAEILRCDKSTVYRLVEAGRLNVVRLGRSFRITQAEINRFLGDA